MCAGSSAHASAGERSTFLPAGAGLSRTGEAGLGDRVATQRLDSPSRRGIAGCAQPIKGLAGQLLDAPGGGRSNTRPHLPGGQVAQLVEQRTENPRVGGSIPPLATISSTS